MRGLQRALFHRPGSGCIKGCAQPFDFLAVKQHHIEAARRQFRQPQQEVTGGKHDASLLDRADAGAGTAMTGGGAGTDLDKDQRAVALAHDQIDLAATAAGRPIIAGEQSQALRLQIPERALLGSVAALLGGGCA